MNTLFNNIKLLTLIVFMQSLSMQYVSAQTIEGGGIGANNAIGGIGKAEKLYNELAYAQAIPLYETYLKKNENLKSMLELGDCYRLTSKFDKAEYWYGKAVEKGDVEPEYKLYYAKMLQANEKYEEAAKWYANYKQSVPEDKRATNQLKASADYGQYLLTRDRFQVKNLSFNTSGYDFAPVWYDKGLIFSSSRDSSKAISNESMWTGTQFFDMYYVEGEKTEFGKPKALKADAATKYHEAAATFTPDKKKVYFTRNNFYNNKLKTSSDKIVKLNIYESDIDGMNWKNDKAFQYNNSEYSVGHPALTADGNSMYFISDMPGGFGGTDIYVTKKEGDSWGIPKNLGEEINTEGMEMFPYVDEEGVLYFASDGQGGLGGLDIFRTRFNEKTEKFGKVRNFGAPVNSSHDDFSLVYGKDKSVGYFTSNRPEGKGLDDIYSFTDDGVYLEGIVVDAETREPICNSKVIMKAKLTQSEEGKTITECDGEFEFGVIKNMDYCFVASADGYSVNDSVCATTKNVKPGETVFVEIPLYKGKEYAMSIQVLGKSPRNIHDSTLVDSLLPLANAKVLLSSKCEGWTKSLETDISGKICEVVRCDCDYIIVANAKGYLPGNIEAANNPEDCKIDRKCGENPREEQVILDPIPGFGPNGSYSDLYNPDGSYKYGQAILLKDIYYDFDKWHIREESELELNKLLSFLQENPSTIVEIGSHTDARAPYDYNIKLSQRRAQSVVDWLVARGVDKKRLKPKGYGETQPVNGCVDGVTCTEYEHQRNRRTEFRVIGNNIDLKSLERLDMEVDPCKNCPF